VETPTVYYSNPAGESVDALDICIADNRAWNGYTPYRAVEITGESYTFTKEDIDALKNITVNTLEMSFVLRTKIGNQYYYSPSYKTFTVTENDTTKPSVSMTATLNNGSLPSKFDGLCIQGKSRFDVSIYAEGKYSATITGYSANIGGEVYNSQPFLSNVLKKSGKVSIVGYAIDSRGFTGSDEQEIEVVEYSKPLVIPLGSETAITCYRSDGNGKRIGNSTSVWVKAKRSYYSLSDKNQCAFEWRKKLVTEAWDDENEGHKWNVLISKTDTESSEYNALLSGVEFDLKKAYTVQIRAIDDIGEQDLKTFEIPTQDVALHLGKGGKNVSVGTYCDYSKEYTFYSDWDVYFDKDVYVGGNKIGDFVVEQGQNGVWTYRKWNSGLAECWGNIAFDFYDNPTANTFSFNYEKDVDLPLNLFDGKPKGLGTVDISGVVNYYAWLSSETKAKIYVNTFMKYGSDNVATLTLYFIGKSKQL
jgi:hypothetical protein